MADERQELPMCLYCGAKARRIGTCKFCGVGVCERCGNSHYSMGTRFVAHDSCIRDHGEGFSMIKFVK